MALVSNKLENEEKEREEKKIWGKTVKDMYLKDKAFLHWSLCSKYHNLVDDRLEEASNYYRNLRGGLHDEGDKVFLFNKMVSRWQQNGRTDMVCCTKFISFSVPKCYSWMKKGEVVYPRSIIKDLTKASFQPFSLQHIAAARSIPTLKHQKAEILIGIYNATKTQNFYVRVGGPTKRKSYLFANIVKHHIYKQMHEPLVDLLYFEHVERSPKPICFKCGLIRKIEDDSIGAPCYCLMCNFLRYVIASTPIIEKPFHTQYHNFFSQ